MRSKVIKLNERAINKYIGKVENVDILIPHYAYTFPLCATL